MPNFKIQMPNGKSQCQSSNAKPTASFQFSFPNSAFDPSHPSPKGRAIAFVGGMTCLPHN